MCGFLQAGRQWLQSGCLVCRPIQGSFLTILNMGSLLQGFPRLRPGGILGTNLGKRLLVPAEQSDVDPKWCTKSGNGHCQVQQSYRCSMSAAECFGLSWMIKLFWIAILCYKKASLCDVFSQKCSAAWQGAPGQRLTVAIMLPGRQPADDWLDFMLSQKNLWPTFATRGTLTEVISDRRQTFRKERRRLQAKHLWMEVKLSWNVLAARMLHSGSDWEVTRATLYTAFQQGRQGQPKESL